MNELKRPRVAVVVSHPIQHFCPQYASLAARPEWTLKVFFASSMGRDAYTDRAFGRTISWMLPLGRFDHAFLNDAPLPSSSELDAPNLDAELAAYAPDVVIIYGYFQKVQRRAHRVAERIGAKVYYISDSEFSHRPPVAKAIAKTMLLHRKFRRIDRVLTVGDANEIFYARCGVPLTRMTRMQYPIDVATYAPAWENRDAIRAATRKAIGADPIDFVVPMVGKLVPFKRQRDLVLAAVERPERLKAVIVGSGADEAELKALAARAPTRVHFTGFVDPADLPGYYAAADAYAHVSSYEPHSLAISEAIYMGLPAIISDRCGSFGPSDDVQPGRNGWVVPTGDPTALAAALIRLADSPTLAAGMGARSRAHAILAQERAHGAFLEEALRADGLL